MNLKNDSSPFFLIAGPCAIESEDLAFEIAERVSEICSKLGIPLVFKGSYRKANRTRLDSFRGIGDEKSLEILRAVKEKYKIPITTDVHESSELETVAEVVDILQIPAFLCRQTELLVNAAKTGKVVNIKKGQFMSPGSMEFALEKVIKSGGEGWITERGTSFGYGDLVVDFRGIAEMKSFASTVVMDCTHSLQRPNQTAGITGGTPEYIGLMANAAIVAGADGLFIETHPEPSKALSDGANMLVLDKLQEILEKAVAIKAAL